MKNNVLDFIQRRFRIDCNWTTGNCYYFAVILKDRFPEGKIYYDVILGHFLFCYQDVFYDWNGIVDLISTEHLKEWKKFDDYDSLQKKRIIKDCIL